MMKDQEIQLTELRSALIAGEASGPPEPFDFDGFVAAKKR